MVNGSVFWANKHILTEVLRTRVTAAMEVVLDFRPFDLACIGFRERGSLLELAPLLNAPKDVKKSKLLDRAEPQTEVGR